MGCVLQLPLHKYEVPDGVNSPAACYPHRRTAILIPYRNRLEHLKIFLRHLHKILIKQKVEYGIYVINMVSDQRNKAIQHLRRRIAIDVCFPHQTKKYLLCFLKM